MSVDSVDPATRGVAGMHGRLGSMPIGRWHASAAPQSAWMVPTSCGRRRASETFDPHVTQMTHLNILVQLARLQLHGTCTHLDGTFDNL